MGGGAFDCDSGNLWTCCGLCADGRGDSEVFRGGPGERFSSDLDDGVVDAVRDSSAILPELDGWSIRSVRIACVCGCTSGIHWWGADGCGDCVFPCPARSAEFGIALVSSNTVSGVAECATEWRGCCGELSVDGTREVVALMVAVCVMQPFLTH